MGLRLPVSPHPLNFGDIPPFSSGNASQQEKRKGGREREREEEKKKRTSTSLPGPVQHGGARTRSPRWRLGADVRTDLSGSRSDTAAPNTKVQREPPGRPACPPTAEGATVWPRSAQLPTGGWRTECCLQEQQENTAVQGCVERERPLWG